MILRVQYKDPDFVMRDVDKKVWVQPRDLEDEIQGRLHDLGIGEYLLVEVDTITGHTRVVPQPKLR